MTTIQQEFVCDKKYSQGAGSCKNFSRGNKVWFTGCYSTLIEVCISMLNEAKKEASKILHVD